ncbi:MAG: PPC domain-containing protein [Verrucomicrobiales bacterium]|nr:PPC domain-containing protein [Verrucomicrobiales bacterium]
MKWLILTLLLFGAISNASAEKFGTAQRILPQVGQRGSETTVLLQGNRLQHIEEILFYDLGISLKSSEATTEIYHEQNFTPLEAGEGEAALLTFKIDPDCRVGEHFFRIRTKETLSEMLSFWVSPFPCVAEESFGHDDEKRSNGAPEMAQPVSINSTVYGYHPAYSTIDHDYYRVDLKKGDRLTVEVWSACLGFEHFRGITDTAITVLDPNRTKIAYADDTHLGDMDPMLSLRVPVSGTYYINIHQNMDFEGSLRHYAAHISSEPRPSITYPPGGPAGSKLKLELIGEALDSRDTILPLPENPGPFEKSILHHHFGNTAYPNLIQIADFENVLEDGREHHSPESAQVYSGSLPVAFNGRIEHEGKTDWFRFTAKKGDRFRVRTYAATLGSAMDAKLWIRPAKGTESRIDIEADDSNWVDHDWWGNDRVGLVRDRMDPVVLFEPEADGDYLLGIVDAQRLFGPDHIYRVEFQPIQNHAFIFFPKDFRESPNKRDTFVLHRNNTVEHTIAILDAPGNQYQGAIEVVADNLPKGVSFQCPILSPGQKLAQVTFTANAEAKPWAGFIDLSLKPVDPDANLTGSYVYNVPATQRRGGYSVIWNKTRRCAFAVVEEAPIRVKVKQPEIGLARNALIDLEVEIERTHGFNGAVQVNAQWLPGNVTKPGPLVIPEGETRGVYRLSASAAAAPGTYPITLTARENEGGDRTWGTGYHFVASPPIDLDIVEPYLEIELVRSAIEKQTEGTIEAKINEIRPLPGNATATLLRLPAGVELVKAQTIKSGDKTLSFPIRVSKDALVGQYQEIACEVVITDGGQKIVQQTGNGTLRIDSERK